MFSSQEYKIDKIVSFITRQRRSKWFSVREVTEAIGVKNKYRVHLALRELVARGFLAERTVGTNLINGEQFFYCVTNWGDIHYD